MQNILHWDEIYIREVPLLGERDGAHIIESQKIFLILKKLEEMPN